MPTNKLGRGMDDDIGTMLERLHQVWRRQRIVYNQRQRHAHEQYQPQH